MVNPTRVFVAIPLPKGVKAYLRSVQRQLRKSGIQASWPSESGMHLTLKFIGNVDEGQILKIQNSMIKAAKRRAPFELIVSGIGGFPSRGRARVIWSGIEGQKTALAGLAGDLDCFLSLEGIKKSKKKYVGHLTLARIKKAINLRHLEHFDFGTKSFLASEMLLYRSILLPSGARHEKMFSAAFANYFF